VYLNGRYVGRLLDRNFGYSDCTVFNSQSNDVPYGSPTTIEIPREFFNDAIWSGSGPLDANFEFVASIAVNPNQCPGGSWVKAHLAYTAAITEDCNANGLLDVCETRDYPETDIDGNGIPDACDGLRGSPFCFGDIDGDGEVGGGDISSLLVRFGMSMPGDPADLDQDGEVGASDISFLLTLFGPC
jgi:hypothetical protein